MCGELCLDGRYDEPLHSLVRLSYEVHLRALVHDGDVALEGLADHLVGDHHNNTQRCAEMSQTSSRVHPIIQYNTS